MPLPREGPNILTMNRFLIHMNLIGMFFSFLFLLHDIFTNSGLMAALSLLFLLGLFQISMSFIQILKRSKSNIYLDLHFVVVILYLFMILGLEEEIFQEHRILLIAWLPFFIGLLFSYGAGKLVFKIEGRNAKKFENSRREFVLDNKAQSEK